MRILFISAYYPPHTRGGAELSTYYVARALIARGHTVDVVTASEELLLQGKPLFEKRASKKMAEILKKRLKSTQPYDIIHAHDFRSSAVVAEMGLATSVVTHRDYACICGTTNNVLDTGTIADCCTTTNLLLHNPRIQEASWLRKPFRMWQYKFNLNYRREVFQLFKNHIFISHAQQAEINKHLSFEGLETQVIYNPISEEYINSPLQAGDENLVTYIGTIDFYKGVGLLLEAWSKITKESPTARLQIVGDGSRKHEYEQYIEKNALTHSVVFKGRIPADTIKDMYDAASIIVAPHVWIEPFGRTVAEAMVRGKLVISANAGGPAEMIQDRTSGFLFERNSVTDLSEKLRYALTLPVEKRNEIGRAAQQWVKHNLSANAIAQYYEDFYKRVIT